MSIEDRLDKIEELLAEVVSWKREGEQMLEEMMESGEFEAQSEVVFVPSDDWYRDKSKDN